MKTPGGKVLLSVNSVYRNGVAQFEGKQVVGDSHVNVARPGSNYRVLTLSFSLPETDALALHSAFQTGDAELNIEGVKLEG